MRIMPPANLPPRSSRAAAAHGRRGQRRRRRICACCFKVITKPDSRAQPESSFLPCRIPTRLEKACLLSDRFRIGAMGPEKELLAARTALSGASTTAWFCGGVAA